MRNLLRLAIAFMVLVIALILLSVPKNEFIYKSRNWSGTSAVSSSVRCTRIDVSDRGHAKGTKASAVVESPTNAAVIPAPIFRHWIATNEKIRAFVFETMASRFVEVVTLVEEVAVRKMDARLAAYLHRAFRTHPDEPVIAKTHDELAAEIGTVRQVGSRVLKEFERHGAVRLGRGHITLADDAMLRQIAGDASPL